jgi:hypothetical protein
MGLMKFIYHEAGSGYQQTLKKLSDDFWEGMGGKQPDKFECENVDAAGAPSHTPDESPIRLKDPNEVNGIVLPQNVINQLRLLGLPIEAYTAGELQDAVLACSADATLVDDHEGIGLRDKLRLDGSEKEERRLRREARICRMQEEEKHHCDEMHKEHLLMEEHDEYTMSDLHLDIRTRNERIRERQEERARRRATRPVENIFTGLKLLSNPIEISECDDFSHGLSAIPYLHMQKCHEATVAFAA